jgi:Na+-driven multidrug efflux pump
MGAAIATTTGRSVGVIYQLFRLFGDKSVIRIKMNYFIPDWKIIKSVWNIAWTGTTQFLIGSASWIVLARIMAEFHAAALAGYQVAIRIIMFFLLPAWGLSNAAATLVGQNLGAMQPQRAEQSVWKIAKYNAVFMLLVSLFFFLFSQPLVDFMNKDANARQYAVQALHIVSLGYIFYGVGMVMMNAFNGAGDTRTPTVVNLFCFWAFQIPLALITVVSVILFRRGKWKKVKV